MGRFKLPLGRFEMRVLRLQSVYGAHGREVGVFDDAGDVDCCVEPWRALFRESFITITLLFKPTRSASEAGWAAAVGPTKGASRASG